MSHEYALGAALKIVSNSGTAPGARVAGDGKPNLLLVVAHGLFVTDVGAGGMTTGTVAVPGTLEVRFSVKHGKQADDDDLVYCLKDLKKWGDDAIDRLWPDQATPPTITDYAVGKGVPEVKGANVADWFRGEEAKGMKGLASAEWVDQSKAEACLKLAPANLDIGRVRKSCRSLADILLSMTAPHTYTHLLLHVCREEMVVRT